jgi:hypothetical protein
MTDPNLIGEQQEDLMKSTSTSDRINPSTSGTAPVATSASATATRVQSPTSTEPAATVPGPVPSSGFSPPKNVSRRTNMGGKPVVVVLTAKSNVILTGKGKVDETEIRIKAVRIIIIELIVECRRLIDCRSMELELDRPLGPNENVFRRSA